MSLSFTRHVDYKPLVNFSPAAIKSISKTPSLKSSVSTPVVQTPRLSDASTEHVEKDDLASRLFDNSAATKMAFSLVSMHLPSMWQATLFDEIDRNLDIDKWGERLLAN